MKIAIIGAGAVGTACLNAVLARGIATEIVLLDRDRKKARGLVTDVQYGVVLHPSAVVRDGDYPDLEGTSLVMIAAGINERAGGATDRNDPAGRLRLLDANVEIFKDIVGRLHAVAPNAMVLVVTDPPDPLADAVRMLGHDHVLSTGTYLDSLRFRFHLARRLGVSPASVEALILGEHGTSEAFIWSSAHVAGAPVLALLARSGEARENARREIEQEVRFANITIIEGIGASQHGIGAASARIAEIILRDERAVIPIGCYSPRHGVTLSLPSVLGRQGVVETLDPELSEDEQKALQRSVEALAAATGRMRI